MAGILKDLVDQECQNFMLDLTGYLKNQELGSLMH